VGENKSLSPINVAGDKMKRIIGAALIVIVLTFGLAIPVSASSLGISPSKIDIEVPQGGSAIAEFKVYYYTGDLNVTLVDLPFEVEPKVIHATTSPTDVVLTFYASAMQPQDEYNGYVRFLSSGNTVALAVNIVATVTVSLSANIVDPPIRYGGGGGGGIPVYGYDADLFGTSDKLRIDYYGKVKDDVEAISNDGNLTISIAKNTTALGQDGKRLKGLAIEASENPPASPENKSIIGLPYTFSPSGATFDPPMELTWNYDPDALPEGTVEEELVIAFYDEAIEEWVELECVVNTSTSAITTSVSHFTDFAILAKTVDKKPDDAPIVVSPPQPIIKPEPQPLPTPITPVAPPPVVEPAKPSQQPVTITATPAPPPPVDTPRTASWWLIIGIVAGSIVVVGSIIVLKKRLDRSK